MSASQRGYDKLLEEWHQYCRKQKIEHYFTDGPVSPKYWSESKRVMVVNLEAYGYEECGHTPIDADVIKHWMLSTGGKIKTKTTRYTGVFVNALFSRILSNKPVSAASIRGTYHDIDRLVDSMNRIAYVNIRKTSNSNVPQDIEMIRFELENHGPFIRRQIEILAPNIIVFGGHEGCNAANRLFDLNDQLAYKGRKRTNANCLLASVKHFSRISYADFAKAVNGIAADLQQAQ